MNHRAPFVAALTVLVALTACGAADDDEPAAEPTSTTTAPSTTADAPTTTAPPTTAQRLPPGAEASDPPTVVHAFATLETTTDCGELQGRFDAAAEGFDRSEKGTDRSDQFLRLMDAADERLEKAGCY